MLVHDRYDSFHYTTVSITILTFHLLRLMTTFVLRSDQISLAKALVHVITWH